MTKSKTPREQFDEGRQQALPSPDDIEPPTLDSKARARDQRERLAERNMQAVNDMVAKHEAELAADAKA